MIIGITGTNGAGKGTVVDYLVQKGFHHYSMREELTREIQKRGMVVDRSSMREVGNDLRAKNGPLYFDKLFLEDAEKNGYKDILIESVRVLQSVPFLKSRGGAVIAVDADRKVRYERSVTRGSETDKIDFDTWVMQEEREWNTTAAHDMNVPAVMAAADYTIQNNGTLEELHTQVDEILSSIQK